MTKNCFRETIRIKHAVSGAIAGLAAVRDCLSSSAYVLVLAMSTCLDAHAAIPGNHESDSRVVVKMKAGHSLPSNIQASRFQHLFGTAYVVDVGADEDHASKTIQDLAHREDVEYVQRSMSRAETAAGSEKVETSSLGLSSGSGFFNDPLLGYFWPLKPRDYSGISIDEAYRRHGARGAAPVIVAVADTGVDYTHEDLRDVMWRNPREIPGNGRDDDQNGYVDDVYGIDVTVRDSNGRATTNIMDDRAHGTHIAGIIAAKQNNGIGIAGIASNVWIMALKALPRNGNETDVDVAEALIYAAKNGARIINCSFGRYDAPEEMLIPDTLEYLARNYGVLVVNSAGNDGENIDRKLRYPAAFDNDNLLVVASTRSNGTLHPYSNFGRKYVDIAAPGIDIYSTLPGNQYGLMSGTSMAAPMAAGVLAEVLSRHPRLSYLELIQILVESATANRDYQNKMAYPGRVDLSKALEVAEMYR